MAEANNAAGTKGRRQMSPQEQLIIHETLGWRQDVHRGATSDDTALMFQGDLMDRGTSFQKPGGPEKTNVPSVRPSELSLMRCNLQSKDGVDVKQMWSDISMSVKKMDNIDPMQDAWAMMGNVYDHGNHCEFLLGLYEVEKKHVLDFKRMSGDGFVMDGFFRNVKNNLPKEYRAEDEVEADGSDDVFEDYSDEEEDGDEELTSYGYLQLSYDKNLVSSWVEKIKTRHMEDQNHIMGLMAYNAFHEENLKIIVEEGGKQLKDLITRKLEESNSAALVRNTSALAAQMTKVDMGENAYNADFVISVFEAMTHWVPGNARKNEADAITFDITESRETVNNLIQVLYNLNQSKLVMQEDMTKEVAGVSEDARDLIESYLNKQQNSDPVNFLKLILNDAKA